MKSREKVISCFAGVCENARLLFRGGTDFSASKNDKSIRRDIAGILIGITSSKPQRMTDVRNSPEKFIDVRPIFVRILRHLKHNRGIVLIFPRNNIPCIESDTEKESMPNNISTRTSLLEINGCAARDCQEGNIEITRRFERRKISMIRAFDKHVIRRTIP